MEYVNFYERIHNIKDLKKIADSICSHYNLGECINQELIEMGYEDFNMRLQTSSGFYFVKMLNKSREKSEQERLVSILQKSFQNGVRVPKIYQVDGKSIFKLEIDNKILNILVMQYIEGSNMLSLNRELNDDEIRDVAREIAKINATSYDVDAYYDEWTITNFEDEYKKKVSAIDKKYQELVTKVYEELKTVDFEKLEHTYIHGDILKSNLILDNDNKIWIIDFSVLNYLPRVIELGVTIFGICLTANKEKTINKINVLLEEYNKYNNLTEYEKEVLPIIFNAICAMNVLQTAYIMATDEDFEENQHWLNEGIKGISLNLTNKDIK